MQARSHRPHRLMLMLFAVAVFLGSATVRAQWAQYGGPNRNFRSPSTGLATQWPADGPRKIWSRDLGDAYSGIAVDRGDLFTMYRERGEEIVIALDANSGATKWQHRYAAPPFNGIDRGFGVAPRSTPLVLSDRIITLGINGQMFCLDRSTGIALWAHDLIKEYNATRPRWGYASSAMAYKETIIVPVGGKGHGIMAFDRATGKVRWSRHDFANAYASGMLIDVDGQEQLVMLTSPVVAGLDPNTGDLLWSYPHETNYDVNASQPVWGDDNLLFISSDYGTGSRALKLAQSNGKTTVEQVWTQKKMRVHFGSTIRIGDLIYGSTGGNGPVHFAAVNAKTGEIAFRHSDLVAKSQLLLADGKLILLDENGWLYIATPTSEGLTIHAKAHLLDRIAWTAPSLVGKHLFIRDQKKIMALDLG